ncbi:hypothetical protein [Micromonospora sp. DT47]|uniref:hypothetical protein n=1 Tax=Micromonospora sp. DT47 TaxID=3393431 RepID=UPI003CF301EA
MTLHENEVPIDEAVVRSLLEAQCPERAGLSLSPAGVANMAPSGCCVASRVQSIV